MARWLDRLPKSPAPWLLERACAPIRYRLLTEVLDRPNEDWDVQRARDGINTFAPALAIARLQQENGVWLGKVLDFEPPNAGRRRGPAMVNQFLALVECGWTLEHPICHCSGELLLQYLDEASTPDIFELKGYVGENKIVAKAVRRMLSRVAAALLTRAGMRDNPKLDAFAVRFLADVEKQYSDSSGAALYDGELEIPEDGKYRRLRADAIPPDMFTLYVLAFHPKIRGTKAGRDAAAKVFRHILAWRGEPRLILEVESRRVMRFRVPRIGWCTQVDFNDKHFGFLLHDLELMARTGCLLEHEKARSLLEWAISFCDPADGVFRVEPGIEKHVTPSQYHYFPIEDSWRGKHKKYTDATFRMMLILRLLDAAEGA